MESFDELGVGAELTEALAATEIVAPGSRFETSGLNSSDYPGGIPVGRLVIENGRTRIEPLADLEAALVPLYFRHRYHLEAAVRQLGGVSYRHAVRRGAGIFDVSHMTVVDFADDDGGLVDTGVVDDLPGRLRERPCRCVLKTHGPASHVFRARLWGISQESKPLR